MTNILSLGLGTDSVTILAIAAHIEEFAAWKTERAGRLVDTYEIQQAIPKFDHILFSDTGAEHEHTYEYLTYLMDELGYDVTVVKKDESIREFVDRLGVFPLMPGAKHVCSKKWKGDVMAKWVKDQGIQRVDWYIGIEANEGGRKKRFQMDQADQDTWNYPLMDLEMTREDCIEFLQHIGWKLPGKSSCVFCPFKQPEELVTMTDAEWDYLELVEARFAVTSAQKHAAWLEAGKPLHNLKSGRTRAPVGMWKKDSWQDGARLIAKRVGGRQLSVSEWREALITSDK